MMMYDPWVAVYILILIFTVVWGFIGRDWSGNEKVCDKTDKEIFKMSQWMGTIFLVFIFGGMVVLFLTFLANACTSSVERKRRSQERLERRQARQREKEQRRAMKENERRARMGPAAAAAVPAATASYEAPPPYPAASAPPAYQANSYGQQPTMVQIDRPNDGYYDSNNPQARSLRDEEKEPTVQDKAKQAAAKTAEAAKKGVDAVKNWWKSGNQDDKNRNPPRK